MNHSVVALVGISGVGKTTFLQRLAKEVEFQHLTAGSLIAAAKAAGSGDRDRLRLSNIDENQRLLVVGFHLARDLSAPLVILDGHVVIHAADSLHIIGAEVFSQIGITGMIHLASSPERIAENRANDSGRDRPLLSQDDLERHQNASMVNATAVCQSLEVPLLSTSGDGFDCVMHFLSDIGCRLS